MKTHWKILIWLLAGALTGGLMQIFLEADPDSGLRISDATGGVQVTEVTGKAKLSKGALVTAVIKHRGARDEKVIPVTDTKAYKAAIASSKIGDVVWHVLGSDKTLPVTLAMDPDSPRAIGVAPFAFLAEMFMRLLKMLIVPIILSSIVVGVIGVGSGSDLGRLGGKTFLYYICTSLIAIVTGLLLVNLVEPGTGAELGLGTGEWGDKAQKMDIWDVLLRMIPENVFQALSANLNMLQVIFFALLFGFFIIKAEEKSRKTMTSFFQAAFDVMMKLAGFVLSLIPYGVFCLLVKVVGTTGFDIFKPLAMYMLTVVAALAIHSLVSLPLILRFVGGMNPRRWAKAVSPALLTAFSTSSSSMTLPVSLETVEKRGKVSNRIVSFVQPLGATINMDGTALYECIGVIFLAQFYASSVGDPLTFTQQVVVVIMALLASIGAAGIPSAGLIMMLTILSTLDLPTEGAALLLAVDRPLDMLRTTTNVWSDTCGAAVIARSEGETDLLQAGT